MKKFIYFLVLVCILSCTEKNKITKTHASTSLVLLTKNTHYVAGSAICINFNVVAEKTPLLVVNNALGISALTPVYDNNDLLFCLPQMYSERAGILNWSLVLDTTEIKAGHITIVPDTASTFMETYFGPKQITAGNEDFSMLVTIATDAYDNTLAENTKVTVNSEFQDVFNRYEVPISKGIAWKNINTTQKAGRILVSAHCNTAYSKQRTTMVYPAMATDFKIQYQRDHSFADGNQILELETGQILDAYGNVVSDGTHVNFIIENQNGTFMSASGNTINGIALAKLLHPEEPSVWHINAYVIGAAQSNDITLNFKAAVEDYKVEFDATERKLSIGPLISFINQKVTDGFKVRLVITSEGNIINKEETLFTKNGLATFILDKKFYPPGNYSIAIESAGVSKKLKIILPHE